MNDQQKDLLRKSLEQQLEYIDSVQESVEGYKNFRSWLRKVMNENYKLELLMLGFSKKDLLLSFKEQINFPQKDFMEIIKPVSLWTDIYDDNLKRISCGDKRFYMINSEHPKYKNFMLSVGLLDANFKNGYIFKHGYSQSLEGFLQNPGTAILNPRCALEFYDSMMDLMKFNMPSTIAELNHYMYYYDNVVSLYEKMEQYGLDNLKRRVLEAVGSEKSK